MNRGAIKLTNQVPKTKVREVSEDVNALVRKPGKYSTSIDKPQKGKLTHEAGRTKTNRTPLCLVVTAMTG